MRRAAVTHIDPNLETRMNSEKEVPFFARYLENQFPAVKTDIKAGWSLDPINPPDETMKYPSDDDEGELF
jgi:hypothetical protein